MNELTVGQLLGALRQVGHELLDDLEKRAVIRADSACTTRRDREPGPACNNQRVDSAAETREAVVSAYREACCTDVKSAKTWGRELLPGFQRLLDRFERSEPGSAPQCDRKPEPDAGPGLKAAFKQIKANGEVLNDVCIKARANTTQLADLDKRLGTHLARLNLYRGGLTDLGTRLCDVESRLRLALSRLESVAPEAEAACEHPKDKRLACINKAQGEKLELELCRECGSRRYRHPSRGWLRWVMPNRQEGRSVNAMAVSCEPDPASEPSTKPSTEEEAALDEIFATLDNLLLEEKFSECRQWLHDADTDKMSLPELMVAMTATHKAIPQLMPDYEQFFWVAYNSAKNRGLDAGQMVGFAPRLADWPVPPSPKPVCEHAKWHEGQYQGYRQTWIPARTCDDCHAALFNGQWWHPVPQPASEAPMAPKPACTHPCGNRITLPETKENHKFELCCSCGSRRWGSKGSAGAAVWVPLCSTATPAAKPACEHPEDTRLQCTYSNEGHDEGLVLCRQCGSWTYDNGAFWNRPRDLIYALRCRAAAEVAPPPKPATAAPAPKPACTHRYGDSKAYWAKSKRVGITTCDLPQCDAVHLGIVGKAGSKWFIPEPASEEGADGAADGGG